MGRLIDADKLRAEYKDPEDIRDSAKALFHVTGIWANIDAADTVEAIPVEWIEAEIKYLKALDFEFASLAAGQIEAMLKKWREEQKAPHCGPDYCDINFGGGTKA